MHNFFRALEQVKPIPKRDIFYRLYYDEKGNVITYSMEDLPGNYIEITSKEFAIKDFNVIVKNNQIYKPSNLNVGKLVPSDKGVGTHPNDITIIDSNSKTKWKWKTYE